MIRYEYKVVPAPEKGIKAKGVKTAPARFALSVEQALNQMAAEGWEYQRAELLPSEERSGLTGSTTNWRNVLVFRRPLPAGPEVLPESEAAAEPVAEATAPLSADSPPLARPVPGPSEADRRAPAPIAAPVNDPPMHGAKTTDAGSTEPEAKAEKD
ncbi:DUF4177 domain-containing protein [Ruegeria pomeroyi]|nr:DUF4177 domain-containing protein [Ruegeria pomeroyi]